MRGRARLVAALAAAALAVLGATGAAAAARVEAAPVMPTTVRGIDGKPIVVRSAARIVSLNGDLTEVIYALGLGRNLVGVDTSAIYPPEAASVTQIGYQRQLNAEGILSLRPTVVIGSTLAGPAAAVGQLKAAGVATVILPEDDRLTAPMSKIRNVARILGVPRRGKVLADRTARQIRPSPGGRRGQPGARSARGSPSSTCAAAGCR
jgi:iron complex transport system substrate-binding protein